MEIELQYFAGCPGWEQARDNLETAVSAVDPGCRMRLREVVGASAAAAAGFRGSPSFVVEGRDLFPLGDDEPSGGLSCRVYETPDGLKSAPTVEMLAAALAAARRRDGEVGCACPS